MSFSKNNFSEKKLTDNNSNDSKDTEKPYTTVIHEWLTTPKQVYRGTLLYDNLHGSGIYFIDKDEKIFFDGFFYANKMEGYCQVFYHNNGTHFQGLFKDNRRFGPGVLTYSDGSQDVGLWDGFSLIRVGTTLSTKIPNLTVSNEGHIKILKYRNLVDVCPQEVPDIAEELLKKLGASEEVLKKANELYSKDVKNKNNLFFNKKIYDHYYPEKVPIIDILIEDTPPSPCQSKSMSTEDESGVKTEEENEKEKQEINILSKKVYMLNNQLSEVGKTLLNIKKDVNIVSKKIEYCNICCAVEDVPEEEEEEEKEQKISKEMAEPEPTILEHFSEIFDQELIYKINVPSLYKDQFTVLRTQ